MCFYDSLRILCVIWSLHREESELRNPCLCVMQRSQIVFASLEVFFKDDLCAVATLVDAH
jgi:hypothetical protein